MNRDRTLTRRYVAALHQLAVRGEEVERVREELGRLEQAAREDSRLATILRHPEISDADKRDLLLRIAGPSPSAITAAFLDLVLEKRRAEVLNLARELYDQIADEVAGVVRAHVDVAWEPDEARKERLREALSRLMGAPVVTEYHLAPEVIAGARVRIGGRVIDGSLSGRATQLVERLRRV